ncbi:dCTP deaminase [Kitasatospora sp. NPDC059088]|uniref:dCTP deaminase n=1 Tax=Kitasatospora sp. NPDC059088 TaxID=3346722 RepID=UPI0036747D05
MSILTGPEIVRVRESGVVVLDPFHPRHVNPNSYNLTLGPTLRTYTAPVLDVRQENETVEFAIPQEGIVLEPGRIYLGSSVEVLGSDRCAPIVKARSGIARLGLFVHVTADLIDIGSMGQTTFQLYAVQPVRLYAGTVLAQVTFWESVGEILPYNGKYMHSRGPQPSQIHRDHHGPTLTAAR